MFWLVFLEALRVLKPSGLLYLNVPSNGSYHRYPVDCWRFYPDAGVALEAWGRRSGLRVKMLESFVGRQKGAGWDDFVAIFLKDEGAIAAYPRRILDGYELFSNGRKGADDAIRNQIRASEDQQRRSIWHALRLRIDKRKRFAPVRHDGTRVADDA